MFVIKTQLRRKRCRQNAGIIPLLTTNRPTPVISRRMVVGLRRGNITKLKDIAENSILNDEERNDQDYINRKRDK